MITIVDYGMGNVGSIQNMLRRLGIDCNTASDPSSILQAKKLILPGVGHFDQAMRNLCAMQLVAPLNEMVCERQTPILGICLGMQLITQGSEEGGQEPGLGWIAARTRRFVFSGDAAQLRVPHMGWNTVRIQRSHPLVADLGEEPRFYFVHTYYVECEFEDNVLCTTQYGFPFASAIVNGHILGTQFHPEKSHKYGLKLLENFAKLA